jgi:hypothetical protein
MLPLLLFMLLAINPEYKQSIEKWRAEREAALKSDTGWLTVAGLSWLKEGRNEIETPPGTPKLGVFEMRSGKVTFHPAEGGAAVEMKPDTSGAPTIFTRGSVSVFVIQRGQRTGIRLKDKNSEYRRNFKGLKWYPVKEHYRIEAKWVPFNPPKSVLVPNVLGERTEEKAPGYAAFTIQGKEYRLEPVLEDGELFFVFKDQTSVHDTYGAGRFLYADAPKNGKIILDFNKAYNPPCAFTPYATCPLPIPQNRLAVRIEAGELRYGDH